MTKVTEAEIIVLGSNTAEDVINHSPLEIKEIGTINIFQNKTHNKTKHNPQLLCTLGNQFRD